MANDTNSSGKLSKEGWFAVLLLIVGVGVIYLLQRETGLTAVQAASVLVLAALLVVVFLFSLPNQWRIIRAKWYGWRINQHHRKQSPFTKTVGRTVVIHVVQLARKGRDRVQSAVTQESESQSADDETATDTKNE